MNTFLSNLFDRLHNEYETLCEEMESFAAAQISNVFNIPFIGKFYVLFLNEFLFFICLEI
jgi:hypothetical protein